MSKVDSEKEFEESIESALLEEEEPHFHLEKDRISLRKLERSVKEMIVELGEDPAREGLLRTPGRVALAYKFLTKGYKEDAERLLNGAIFNECYNEIVIVKDIDFYSLCEHHLLPFYGKCHVAYLPDKKIIGLSKIPRIVEMYSRRLQVQERLTTQIGDLLFKVLEPKGVAVVCEARHLCMMMRGVEKQNSIATTSCMLGVFKSEAKTRSEFLKLIGSSLR
jgi:GTP cyclohydrolase I